MIKIKHPITACKQYCLAAGATQGNIAYTQTVIGKFCKLQTYKWRPETIKKRGVTEKPYD
jgi:hypothetical protein